LLEKNKGVTRDRRSIKDGNGGGQSGKPGRPNSPPISGETTTKTPSLFS
jgi:hypothetical protein